MPVPRGDHRGSEPASFAVDAVGFEPTPDHFAALSAAECQWRSLRYLPLAIGG